MSENPLSPPEDKRLLWEFLAHFDLQAEVPPRVLLGQVAVAFSLLPYENLTKIVKQAEFGRAEKARRIPGEVLADHIALGTGGTCFSLTATFLHLLRCLDWTAEPILADRRYGENTHCALLVWIDGRPNLLDPGYLIVDPVPLDCRSEQIVRTPFNQLILSPGDGDAKVDLHTVQQGKRNYRLTFKAQPADAGEFLKAWNASFGWDMMRYPLLTRVGNSKQLYLHGTRYQIRSGENVLREELTQEELATRIATDFGIESSIVIKALTVLQARGERYGKTRTC